MSSVSFHTEGFRAALNDLHAALLNNAHQALKSALAAAKAHAKASTLFKDGPQAVLRNSVDEKLDGPFEGRVFAGAKHGKFVEDGTRPHIIAAKGKALRFVIQGQTFFRKVVHHPGTQARPFMGEAADVGEQTLDYGLELMSERPIAHFNSGE